MVKDLSLKIKQLVTSKFNCLKEHGIDISILELKIMLAHILNTDVGNLYFYDNDISEKQLCLFDEMIKKRESHCPVDKILGTRGFYKYDFDVNADVLSPRQDSEVLIEEALILLKNFVRPKILELGTGSGCLIISLLADRIDANGVGIDISEKALNVTKRNAIKNNVFDRLVLQRGSWFDKNITDVIETKFDLIISNPPYIPSADIEKLDDEVKNFDPLVALDGGDDGLRDYRQICKIAPSLLNDGGFLVFEAGINQADDIAEIAKKNNLSLVKKAQDLVGVERCIILKK